MIYLTLGSILFSSVVAAWCLDKGFPVFAAYNWFAVLVNGLALFTYIPAPIF
jgi:hypothetical protein